MVLHGFQAPADPQAAGTAIAPAEAVDHLWLHRVLRISAARIGSVIVPEAACAAAVAALTAQAAAK